MVGFEFFNPVQLVGLIGTEIAVGQLSLRFPDHGFNHAVTRRFVTSDDVIEIDLGSPYFGGELHLGLAGFFEKFL